MSYPGNDRFAIEIKSFYQEMIDRLTHDDWKKLDNEFEMQIRKYMQENKEEKWYLTVYKRRSCLV